MELSKDALIRNIQKAFGSDDLPECFKIFEFYISNLSDLVEKEKIGNDLSILKGTYCRIVSAYQRGSLQFEEHNQQICRLSPGIFGVMDNLSSFLSNHVNSLSRRSANAPNGYEVLVASSQPVEICTSSNPDFVVQKFNDFLDFWEVNARIFISEKFDYNPVTGEERVVKVEEKVCWATGIQICNEDEKGNLVEAEITLDREKKTLVIKVRGNKEPAEILMNQIRNWWKQQKS